MQILWWSYIPPHALLRTQHHHFESGTAQLLGVSFPYFVLRVLGIPTGNQRYEPPSHCRMLPKGEKVRLHSTGSHRCLSLYLHLQHFRDFTFSSLSGKVSKHGNVDTQYLHDRIIGCLVNVTNEGSSQPHIQPISASCISRSNVSQGWNNNVLPISDNKCIRRRGNGSGAITHTVMLLWA